jgi:hypothetical protein
MASETERAARVLPNTPNGYRLQRRAMSRGVSRTTAHAFHNATGRPFFLSAREAKAGRSSVPVARFNVAGLLTRARTVSSRALDALVPRVSIQPLKGK